MLEERINKEYIAALKEKNAVKSSTLNFLRAAIKNVRIDKMVEKVDETDIIAVIKKQIKQRQDSIDQFQKGGRMDLVEKETAEMEVLKTYLPQELSESELKGVIETAIIESQATSIKDMGKVMKIAMEKTSGRADSKTISDLVKQKLSTV